MKEKAQDFLKHETYCVISTVSPEGRPESALVAFSEDTDLAIMIGTSKNSRKFKNITRNSRVSIVFGLSGPTTLQYEGVAGVPDAQELQKRLKSHYFKQPTAAKYENDPEQTYIIIEPTWIRLTQSGPTVLDEMRFDSV